MGYYSAGDAAQAMMQSTGRSHAPLSVASSSSSPSSPPSDRTYRRTNAGNVKALRRAMRRMQSFEKLAHSVMSFTHRKAGAKFKFHRRKKR